MSIESSSWLTSFVAADRFFKPCGKCAIQHSAREATINFYDVDAKQELCSVCVNDFPRDNVIQVRRSSYHDVVKVADMSRMADIAGIQSYVINGSKVLFLRRRPQPRPPKGAIGASQCNVCSRHLQDVSTYCSLQCKLDCKSGVKNVSLRAVASSNPSDSRSSGPDTPHLLALKPLLDSGSDSETGGESSESRLAKRRKGLPTRSPME